MDKPKRNKYQRHIDPELARAKCKAALAMRKRVGRRKGSRNSISIAEGIAFEEERTALNVLATTRDIIKVCADIEGLPMTIFMKRLADQLKLHPKYSSAFV